jgi:hypothetical protein
MKHSWQWGAIGGAGMAVLLLAFYLLGFQSDRIEAGQSVQWLSFLVIIASLYLAVREGSQSAGSGGFSYWRGVGASTIAGLACAVVSSVYTYIHFSFIHPGFMDFYMDYLGREWRDQGLSSEQIEASEQVIQFIMKPAMQAVLNLIMTTGVGFGVGLILGAIHKRAPLGKDVAPPSL